MEMTTSPKRIILCVCEEFRISETDLRKKSNQSAIALPRHIAAYLLRNDVRYRHPLLEGKRVLSFPRISLFLSPSGAPKHHTTVMHSVELIGSLLADPTSGPRFAEAIQRIRSRYHESVSNVTCINEKENTVFPGRDFSLRTLGRLEARG